MTITQKIVATGALAVTLWTLSAGLPSTRWCEAEAAHGSSDEQRSAELKALEDPTIIKRRAWLETEWNKYENDSHNVEETLGGLWAWRVSDGQDWAVRLKLPYKWHLAGDGADDGDEQGLGDIKVATGTAFRLGKSWRVAGGLDLRMPTAHDDLGDDIWRLQEFGTVAWDPTGWLTLSPSAEHNHSVAEIHDAPPSHYLELFFPATFLLPHRWSVTPRYELKVNFENNNYVAHSAKLSVSKRFDNLPLGFTLSIKRPFDGGAKEFQVNWVMNYYFSD
jgi:hypothetical protein